MHSAKLTCYQGYDYTKDGKENDDKTFGEVECKDNHYCVSGNGSFVLQSDNYIVSSLRGCQTSEECSSSDPPPFYKLGILVDTIKYGSASPPYATGEGSVT